MEETPRYAHLMVLLFLGAGLGMAVGLFGVLWGVVRKARLGVRLGASVALLCAGSYLAVLIGTGTLSSDKTLPEGTWKYFCEPDCHIAYSVASVQTAETLGMESKPLVANGKFVVVGLKAWFDEKSISKFRGDGPLTPVPRIVSLFDATGRTFLPMQSAPTALRLVSTPLAQPLRPGDSYVSRFVFDIPRDAKDLRLLIADDDPIAFVTIDHENSPFHGKIYLSLEPVVAASSASIH